MSLSSYLESEGIVHIVDARSHLFNDGFAGIEISQYRFTQGTIRDISDLIRSGPVPFAYIEQSGRVWVLNQSSGVVLIAGRKANAAQEIAAEAIGMWLAAQHDVDAPIVKKSKQVVEEPIEESISDE